MKTLELLKEFLNTDAESNAKFWNMVEAMSESERKEVLATLADFVKYFKATTRSMGQPL